MVKFSLAIESTLDVATSLQYLWGISCVVCTVKRAGMLAGVFGDRNFSTAHVALFGTRIKVRVIVPALNVAGSNVNTFDSFKSSLFGCTTVMGTSNSVPLSMADESYARTLERNKAMTLIKGRETF